MTTHSEAIHNAFNCLELLASVDGINPVGTICRQWLEHKEQPTDDHAIDALTGAVARELTLLRDRFFAAEVWRLDEKRITEAYSAFCNDDAVRKAATLFVSPIQDNVLWLDSLLANSLNESGKDGAKHAAALLEKSRERCEQPDDVDKLYASWEPNDTGMPQVLLRVIASQWRDNACDIAENGRRLVTPALRRDVHERLLFAGGKQCGIKRQPLVPEQGRGELGIHANGRVVASFQPTTDNVIAGPAIPSAAVAATLDAMFIKGIGALRKRPGQMLLRWLIEEGHRQHCAGKADFRTINVEGGFRQIARGLKFTGSADITSLHEALDFLGWMRLKIGSIELDLLSYDYAPEAPGKPARLSIRLGDVLLPGMVHDKRTVVSRLDKFLVPVLSHRYLPPFAGHRKTWWRQEALLWRLSDELCARSKEYAIEGSIRLTDKRVAELADTVELTADQALRAFTKWTHPYLDGPQGDLYAVFRRAGPEQYTLAPIHDGPHRLLVQQGLKRTAGKTGGRRNAARKNRRF